jgi:hypothetical protein
VVEWDPARDPHLPANYTAQFPDGKQICKKFLQKVRDGAATCARSLVGGGGVLVDVCCSFDVDL